MLFNHIPLITYEGEGTGSGGGSAAPPANTPPQGESEVEKAYRKLRDAEAENRTLRAENSRLTAENANIETLTKDKDALEKRATEAEGKLGTLTTEQSVTAKATELKFRSPKLALDILRGRQADLSDENKIKTALEGLAKEDASMVGPATPPPPSGGQITPQNGSDETGANFNTAIRQAAGRAPAA